MIIDELTDQSEHEDLMNVALLACIMIAELEGELIHFPKTCVVDYEAAANAYFLATVPDMTATQAGCYMQTMDGWRAD